MASVTLLERNKSGDKIPYQSHPTTCSVQRHGNNIYNNSSIDNGGDSEESIVPSTQFEGGAWIEENILHMPSKIQIMELNEVLTKFIYGRGRRRGMGKGRQRIILNRCDRDYVT